MKGALGDARWLPIPLAVVAMLVGWFVLDDTLAQHAGHAHAYQAGGLSLTVDQMTWMSNDMSGQGPLSSQSQGFAMDPSMMPGMQTTNNNRLRLEVTFRNDGADAQQYAMSDFAVVAPDGHSWPTADDGGNVLQKQATLAAGYAATIDLYFDIPVAESKGLAIEWSRGGTRVQIPVDTSGQPQAHKH